jgi:cyanophycinase
MNPACIGIGLGEDTALIIKKGDVAACSGSGMVIIMDGINVGHTNIAYAERDTPVCIENLKVHVLSNGTGYSLKERKFIPSKKDLKIESLTKVKLEEKVKKIKAKQKKKKLKK